MTKSIFRRLLTCLLVASPVFGAGIEVDFDNVDSIKKAAAQVGKDLLTFYHGNEPGMIPGILPGPPPGGDYYWWQGGAMWGGFIDYWHYTKDDQFNSLISQAMTFQVGKNRDYNPANWSASMGNDDQAFWGISAMLAAEYNYPNPPSDQPQWLALVQAVFNEQTSMDRRVSDNTKCNWGLRWQVYPSNTGWDYINTIANACYFNLGARLARYMKNDTFAEAASKTWDFIYDLGYVDKTGNVYDGAHQPNCDSVTLAQFTYNAAMLIHGSAFLYNYTTGANQTMWKDRLELVLKRSITLFFPDGIAYEPSCEPHGSCNSDMRSYKGYLHRWLAATTRLAPFTTDTIMPLLKSSAQAGVKTCTGGTNGRMCGFSWRAGKFEGTPGAGEQMNMLAALSSLLIDQGTAPVTNNTGGTSQGDPNAGLGVVTLPKMRDITAGDKAGAAIVTILIISGAGAVFWFMST